ncbi:hypothetical protein Btru_070991 [Bulinus truncatus]|nr:hypothetical protein Btru_070991 [Bulinus truncatus]
MKSFKSKNSDVRDAIKLEKSNKDEEQKYLNFAKEVTDDVRSRNMKECDKFSNVLSSEVFENHIERKHELDEDRMRKVIKDLKEIWVYQILYHHLFPVIAAGEGNTISSEVSPGNRDEHDSVGDENELTAIQFTHSVSVLISRLRCWRNDEL